MSRSDPGILAAVLSATTIADLLGVDVSAASVRKLRVQIHPDRFGGDDAAWRKLDALLAAHHGPAAPAPASFVPLELRAGKRTYRLTSRLAAGSVADIYATEHDGAAAVAKVAGDPRDNDLLAAEAATLRAIAPNPAPAKLEHMLPRLLDSFELRSGAARRRVNVITRASTAKASPDPGYVSVADVIAAYPAGLDFRDAAWIARRMLGVLGLVHTRGHVHAAVLPQHVLVHPTEHDALLVDWCYAVPLGSKGRALVKGREDFYPPELRAGKLLGPQADVYMFGACVARLLGATATNLLYPSTVPQEIKLFLHSCMIGNPSRRPADAWELHEQLGEILVGLVGSPKFRVLAMPPAATST